VFSPDGRTAYTGSMDRTLCRWDADKGVPGERPVGHTGVATAVAFAPDGASIASGGYSDGIRIWTADGGPPVHKISTDGRAVGRVQYSAGGTALAAMLFEIDAAGRMESMAVEVWNPTPASYLAPCVHLRHLPRSPFQKSATLVP
jgi:WD40 repeat protein